MLPLNARAPSGDEVAGPGRAKGMGSVSNGYGDTQVAPRTLAGATILQIVPALREEPVARTAVNVAHALLQCGRPRADRGRGRPAGRGAQGVRRRMDSARQRHHQSVQAAQQARASRGADRAERIDIVHAQSIGGAWSASMAAAQIAVWLVTTLPDVPPVVRAARVLGERARARRPRDRAVELRGRAGDGALRPAARAASPSSRAASTPPPSIRRRWSPSGSQALLQGLAD